MRFRGIAQFRLGALCAVYNRRTLEGRKTVHLRREFPHAARRWLLLIGVGAGLGILAGSVPTRADPPIGAPADARVDAALARALGRPIPAVGIAIGVTLREADIPRRGPSRLDAVHARQQSLGSLIQ